MESSLFTDSEAEQAKHLKYGLSSRVRGRQICVDKLNTAK